MNRFILAITVLACLILVSSIQAQVTVGLRGGYAFTGGKLSKTQAALSDFVSGQIPITIEAGYRVLGRLIVGGYAEIGPTLLNSSFKNQGDSGSDVGRLTAGVQALWNFMPQAVLQPWAGLGAGWDMMDITEDRGSAFPFRTYKYRGLEFARIQTGINYRVTGKLSIGPAIAIGIGRYSSGTVEELHNETKLSIDPAVHEWVSFALRVSFVF